MSNEFNFCVYHHKITLALSKAEYELKEPLKWPLIQRIKIPNVLMICLNYVTFI